MPIYKKVNQNFFHKWTNNMAYVLGFFAADGNIITNKRGAQFWTIEIKDKILLYRIREALGSDHKISIRRKNNKGICSKTYRLQIGSMKMCNDLRKLGFKDNKTKNLPLPYVPNRYLTHFIRGYFDGDGNVWVGFVHKNRKTKTLTIRTVFTSVSKAFLISIRSKFDKNNIKNGVLRKGCGNFYTLTYSVCGSLNLYHFMYNDIHSSDLFLGRKKQVFCQFIKMRV